MDTLSVLAKKGTKCPREEDPRKYIPDSGDAVTVQNTSYYRRLVSDGSLVIQQAKAAAKKKEVKE